METGAAPAACPVLMGGGKSALQHLLAQKERKDRSLNQPWWVLAVVKLCDITFCGPKATGWYMAGWERNNIKIDMA